MSWSQEQIRNATTIYRVGVQHGASLRDIQIALITAMVESNLINVNYGDRDSLGLFQQRPSQGWGTPEQVSDPVYAAGKFFDALKGLGDKKYQMSMGEAAQAVQRSAYPDRYAERIPSMRDLWPTIERAAGNQVLSMDGTDYGSANGNSDANGSVAPTIGGQQLPYQPMDMNAVLALGETQTTPAADVGGMLGASSGPALGAATDGILGAAGMEGSALAASSMPVDPFASGMGTFLSQGTNEHVITPLAQVMGGFEPGVDGWRKGVIAAAKSALGKPYVWGGTSLVNGVDCSGLIQAAFARMGRSMPRISYQQANLGHRVGESGLMPGDLVAWDNSSRNSGADHIAIYIGNGMIIESPRPGLSVRIRKLGKNLEGGWGVHL